MPSVELFPHLTFVPSSIFLQAWGWVQEMYGFAIGAWKAGIERFDLHLQMMAQVCASALSTLSLEKHLLL